MEFFSFLKKRPGRRRSAVAVTTDSQPVINAQVATEAPAPAVTPEEIRQLLFDAVAAGDESKLDALCHEHQAAILEHGQEWLTVPVEFQSNPQIREWYELGLKAIAQYCSEQLQRHGLMEVLERPSKAAQEMSDHH